MLSIDEADSLIGETLKGAYRIIDRIGAGAMGYVYRAVQLAIGREVAVKVLNTADLPPSALEEAAERFRREARALSLLTHPNIVRLIDFGQTRDGMWFLVLEMLKGQPLAEIIRTQAPLDHIRVARIGRQIARALTEAHASGIVHRDLKPDNIFLCTYDGDPDFVRIMDFGIARVVDDRAFGGEAVTQRHTVLGSPNYMAPEQSDAATVTVAADLYSLGIVLYECLMGAPPFRGSSFMEIAIQHARDEVPALEHDGMREGELSAWRALMTQLLEKEAVERLHSASDAADTLAAIEQLARQRPASDVSSEVAGAVEVVEDLDAAETQPPNRRRIGLMVVAALLFIGIGAVLPLMFGSDDAPNSAHPAIAPPQTRTTEAEPTLAPPMPAAGKAAQPDAAPAIGPDAHAEVSTPTSGPDVIEVSPSMDASPSAAETEPSETVTGKREEPAPKGTTRETTKKKKKKKKKKRKKKKSLGIEFRRN